MNILFIAPLPPPITGHSNVSNSLFLYLNKIHKLKVINLSLGSNHNGKVTLIRLWQFCIIILKIIYYSRNIDRIYITISESIAGNIKDIILYLLTWRLNSRTIIHLHGGSFQKGVLNRSVFLKYLNKKLLYRIGAVIISGPSHSKIFNKLISNKNVHIIQV